MYQNKFLHKQAATPLFDTAKKYLAQLGKGVQDKWNSLDEDTRDALKVAAPSALIAGTGSWLLGDEDRSVGRKALDSVLWGGGAGTAAFGGTKLAKHLLRVKKKQSMLSDYAKESAAKELADIEVRISLHQSINNLLSLIRLLSRKTTEHDRYYRIRISLLKKRTA